MTKEKEQICLEAVSQVLRDNFGEGYFSIGRPKECAACLERSADGWKVCCVERGNEFDVKIHHNVVDACADLIVRIGINDDPEDLIDQFYSLIIEGGDVNLTPPATKEAKRVDKYYDPVYQESFQKAYFESQVRNLKIIMARLGFSAEQAMDLLKVPEEERARYKAAIEDAKK